MFWKVTNRYRLPLSARNRDHVPEDDYKAVIRREKKHDTLNLRDTQNRAQQGTAHSRLGLDDQDS